MQLLSQDSEQLVFHLERGEVLLLRRLVRWGLTAQRGPIPLSRNVRNLPAAAAEDFSTAQTRRAQAHRTFLEQVFSATGSHLKAPAAGRKGYGLTLRRPEVEQLLQALNEIKLAHWERLGCPDEDSAGLPITSENQVSEMVVELSNQLQCLLLAALGSVD